MIAIVFFAAASALILPAQAAKHFNSTILSEEIIYYQNEYLSLEIVGEGEDSIIYLNIDRPIDAGDEILFNLRLKHSGDSPLIHVMPEVNLCDLLLNEINEPDGIAAAYKMSQAFNLDGYLCPIQKTVIKLVPWVLMKEHSFTDDLPCGKYSYEVTLDKCGSFFACDSLIVADLEVMMMADHCY